MKDCQYYNISNGHWASSGQRNGYKWFAMTNYFDAKLFTINDYAKKCNEQVISNGNNLEGFWKILKAQLNNETLLSNHAEVCVMNSEDIYHSETQLEMNERIREYFGFNKSIISSQNNRLGIDYEAVKNKTVVIPFVYLEPQSLDFLDFFAPKIIHDCGVKSVIVIFACYLADNQNGKVPNNEDYPNISQNSFAIEISFETFRGIMDLMNSAKPSETFSRKAKPVSLSGTTWKSMDGKHRISFDQHSVNGANYNGDFTIYSYDSTNNVLFLHIEDNFGCCQDVNLKVISLSQNEMILDGKWGRITLVKQ